jgi:hypothetical protein
MADDKTRTGVNDGREGIMEEQAGQQQGQDVDSDRSDCEPRQSEGGAPVRHAVPGRRPLFRS